MGHSRAEIEDAIRRYYLPTIWDLYRTCPESRPRIYENARHLLAVSAGQEEPYDDERNYDWFTDAPRPSGGYEDEYDDDE